MGIREDVGAEECVILFLIYVNSCIVAHEEM